MSTQVNISANERKRKSVEAARRSIRRRTTSKKIRAISNKIHEFVRTCSTGATLSQVIGLDEYNGFTYNGSSTGGFNCQLVFALTGMDVYFGGVKTATIAMPNYAEFTSMYDQYRIDWVEVRFMFSNNSSSVNSPATVLPAFYIAKDYDDANSAGRPELEQYNNLKIWQAGGQTNRNGIFKVRVKPRAAVQYYNGVASGYGPTQGQPRIDTSSPAVPHYGLKMAWDTFKSPAASTIIGYLNIAATYHMTMFNTK